MKVYNNKILLVEDDSNFGAVLRDYLSMSDFNVVHAVDGEQGKEIYLSDDFDLCILDVMMPKKDGFTLAEEIKRINPLQPIIFLTARNLKEDVLKGYKTGAHDYITKPFDTEVLLYKIKAILQRNSIKNWLEDTEIFEMGNTYFNAKIRVLKVNDREFKLSPKETSLLKMLYLYRGDIMPRELALVQIWGDDSYFTTRSMDVYIAKLRKYLSGASIEIVNVHGEGFRLVDLIES